MSRKEELIKIVSDLRKAQPSVGLVCEFILKEKWPASKDAIEELRDNVKSFNLKLSNLWQTVENYRREDADAKLNRVSDPSSGAHPSGTDS